MTAAKEDLNTPLIVVIGVVSAVVTFVLIVLLQAWFNSQEAAEYHRKVVAPKSEELSRVVAEQQSQLQQYGWVDRERGIVTIPIERAMELVVSEAGRTNPNPDSSDAE